MISAGVILLAGCSAAYQAGQTPDDVYYSAPKEVRAGGNEEYLAVDNNRDKYSADRNRDNNPDNYETYRNDRWMRMSIGNPYYRSTFNNYYWNDWGYAGNFGYNHGFNNFYGSSGLGLSLGYGYLNSWNNPWGNSIYWNSFYNPYAFNYNPYGYNHIGIAPGIKPVYRTSTARPSVFNPRAYGNTNGRSNTNSNRTYYNPRTGAYSNYSNTNSANGTRVNTNTRRSNSAGTYYNTNSSRQNNSYTPSSGSSSEGRPQRTYTPSPSSGSSSGGSSGGGGGVTRPRRGN